MAYGGLVGQSSAEAENVGYNNKNTSTIITSDNVQGAIDQLFTSVSEGKSLVAKAVTDKGVQTALDATFEKIAENVGKIDAVTEATIKFPVEIVTIISIAKAVTDKGVQTALDATFEKIAENVGKIDAVTEATIKFPVEIVTIISRDDNHLRTLPSNATHVLVISDYGKHPTYFGYKFYKIIGQTVQELSNEGSLEWKSDYTFEKYENYWNLWNRSTGSTLRHLEFYYKQ